MKAELISVGTELLLGEITNTDAKFLAEELSRIGISVYHQCVVGDNRERLAAAVNEAVSRSDIVITSGGLGPTPDDLTKEVVCECMGERLILHEESLVRMREYFAKTNRRMPDNNIKQAMLPENGTVLKNNNGTAPGAIIEKNGKIAVMLPGPPRELEPMYYESVKPYLEARSDTKFHTRVYRIFGKGESAVAEELADLMESSKNPTVAPYAKTGEVHIRAAASGKSDSECERLIETVADRIKSAGGDCLYSDDGKNLYETVVQRLIEKKITVAAAESCTGGLIAKTITDIAGASEIFGVGIVTYSNAAKEKYLGVKHETLEKYGAVSEQTAYEMAVGIRETSGADIGCAVTGIAGPGGGSKEKPVGLVYAAAADKNGVEVKKLLLNGDRSKIRTLTVMNVFDMIRRKI